MTDSHHNPEAEDRVDEHAKERTNEHAETPERLDTALKLITTAVKGGEHSGFGVEAVASTAAWLRRSILFAPLRAAWAAMPASLQREMALAEQSAVGEFFMKFLPILNPKAFFFPCNILGALALTGVLKFKMNAEEEKQMAATLGENPSPVERLAAETEVERKVIATITLPGEGIGELAGGKLGMTAAKLEPGLTPAVAIAKGGEALVEARDGWLSQVRERVYALEMAEVQGDTVNTERAENEEETAFAVSPQVRLHKGIGEAEA